MKFIFYEFAQHTKIYAKKKGFTRLTILIRIKIFFYKIINPQFFKDSKALCSFIKEVLDLRANHSTQLP